MLEERTKVEKVVDYLLEEEQDTEKNEENYEKKETPNIELVNLSASDLKALFDLVNMLCEYKMMKAEKEEKQLDIIVVAIIIFACIFIIGGIVRGGFF